MKAGDGLQVSDDTRRSALAQLKAQSLSLWADRAPSDMTDGSFACPALLDTSREVMACGSPLQQATFLHVATNSIQCCWQKQADGTSKVLPLPCTACGVALTLAHLAVCKTPDGVSFRAAQKLAVLNLTVARSLASDLGASAAGSSAAAAEGGDDGPYQLQQRKGRKRKETSLQEAQERKAAPQPRTQAQQQQAQQQQTQRAQQHPQQQEDLEDGELRADDAEHMQED